MYRDSGRELTKSTKRIYTAIITLLDIVKYLVLHYHPTSTPFKPAILGSHPEPPSKEYAKELFQRPLKNVIDDIHQSCNASVLVFKENQSVKDLIREFAQGAHVAIVYVNGSEGLPDYETSNVTKQHFNHLFFLI